MFTKDGLKPALTAICFGLKQPMKSFTIKYTLTIIYMIIKREWIVFILYGKLVIRRAQE